MEVLVKIFGSLLGVDKKFMSRARENAVKNMYRNAKEEVVKSADNLGAARTVLRGGKQDAAEVAADRALRG
jgi:hypothetical protein